MNLKSVVKSMRKTAKENPHNPKIQPVCPEVCLRDIEYDGVTYEVVLTYNITEGTTNHRHWQVSISTKDETPVADVAAFELATEFLGDAIEEVEFPDWFVASLDPVIRTRIVRGVQKQFVALE